MATKNLFGLMLDSLVYDGSTCPSDFIRSFQIQALYQDWDGASQLTHIPLFLKGKAKRVYDALTIKTTIKHVTDELLAKYAQSQDQLLYQFYERKRHDDESISKYALALQDLLQLAVPSLEQTTLLAVYTNWQSLTLEQTTLLRAQLCLSLPDHLKALIQFSPSMSWDDLLACLDKAFPHVIAHGDRSTSRWDSHQSQPLIKQEPVDTHFADAKTSRGSARFAGNCHYCGKPGHKLQDRQTVESDKRLQSIATAFPAGCLFIKLF